VRTLPEEMIRVLVPFAPLFSKRRVWQHVQLLLAGTILAPSKKTIASALRAVGLEDERRFCRYHRVLSRAVWSSREASRILLGLLVEAFVPEEPLVLSIDETLERRRGKKISAKGVYRDPVRSSREHFVKTSGLRWVCLTLLAEVPWASRVWALPFLSALAYSERYAKEHGKRHKALTEWAWQLLLLVRRWHPEVRSWLSPIVPTHRSSFLTAVVGCLTPSLSSPACVWTPPSMSRLRLAAAPDKWEGPG
jgi:hypothetical protein